MDQKAARTSVAKVFKARGVKLRKGHWRLGDPKHDSVVWYVDLRADRAGPTAPLRFEIGGWVGVLSQPEPEGGAVDCPLLLDRTLDVTGPAAVMAATDALVDELTGITTTSDLAAALRERRLDGALVDRALRDMLV